MHLKIAILKFSHLLEYRTDHLYVSKSLITNLSYLYLNINIYLYPYLKYNDIILHLNQLFT